MLVKFDSDRNCCEGGKQNQEPRTKNQDSGQVNNKYVFKTHVLALGSWFIYQHEQFPIPIPSTQPNPSTGRLLNSRGWFAF